jgi:uncharacterized protein YndB with AHSA1/START domain/heme-degrading monooxygenase HmoA
MIARMWRGLVHAEKLAEYVDIVERTGMSGYRSTPGNAGAQLLTRDLGNGSSELVTLSWWADLDKIRAFAGDDIEVAKYYPEDDEYLLEREHMVAHYTVAPPHQLPSAAPAEGDRGEATGFSLSRVMSGSPPEVFAHFTEAELFANWFVVAGFTTPASRVDLDPRPGGTISAVLIPEDGEPEIAFTAAYGIVEPQSRIQFRFTDPTEIVTLSLLDLAEEGTQVTYTNVGAALAGRAAALRGVARMLDALERSVADLRRKAT